MLPLQPQRERETREVEVIRFLKSLEELGKAEPGAGRKPGTGTQQKQQPGPGVIEALKKVQEEADRQSNNLGKGSSQVGAITTFVMFNLCHPPRNTSPPPPSSRRSCAAPCRRRTRCSPRASSGASTTSGASSRPLTGTPRTPLSSSRFHTSEQVP